MNDLQPPTLDQLRAFVRNEVTADEKSHIYRWLVRCPDPDLPAVLSNLQFEWKQQQADESLDDPQRELSAFFLTLWESQRADYDTFRPTPRRQTLKYASGPADLPEGITLSCVDAPDSIADRRNFRVEAFANPTRRRAVGIWTSDDPDQPPQLFFDESLAAGHAPRIFAQEPFEFEESDRRVTFWFATADDAATIGTVPAGADLILSWLQRLHDDDDARVSANRLTTRALTDHRA